MAPVRRYLRISKYSVLECRIYLDNPALAQSWLLNPRHRILPRVIESIRPLVLPKIREERERSRKRSTKKRSIKDVIVQDDFEVSMFLTETATRHSLLAKNKHFHDKASPRMQSNSSKLLGASVDASTEDSPVILREQDSEENVVLADIPAAEPSSRPKRHRKSGIGRAGEVSLEDEATPDPSIEIDSDEEEPAAKRSRNDAVTRERDEDDKKKLAMDVTYEGFAIYGRVLCLVVKKRESNKAPSSRAGSKGAKNTAGLGQARMEDWITSTQIPVGEEGP